MQPGHVSRILLEKIAIVLLIGERKGLEYDVDLVLLESIVYKVQRITYESGCAERIHRYTSHPQAPNASALLRHNHEGKFRPGLTISRK